MAKLPKHLIKKYGISKKAWAVFRAEKGQRKRVSKSKHKYSKVMYMAKRKHKKGYRKAGKSGLLSKAMDVLLGAAVAGAYEVFLSPRIPLNRNVKNIVELIIGLVVAAMPRMPRAVRAGGLALATINAFEIIVPLIAGASGATSSNSSLNDFMQ